MIAVLQHVKADHAGNLPGIAVVKRGRLSITVRTTGHDGIQHVGQLEIEAVELLTGTHRLAIDVGYGLSNHFEFGCLFELGSVGHRLQRGFRGQFRVAQTNVSCAVYDIATVGQEAGRRPAQSPCCGGQQHGSCTGTRLAHRRVVQANAQAAARELIFELRVPVSLFYLN